LVRFQEGKIIKKKAKNYNIGVIIASGARKIEEN